MESEYVFAISDEGTLCPVPGNEALYEAVKDACHRLRPRVGSGKTMVRVEVKRIKD
jgi:hypothetical protein